MAEPETVNGVKEENKLWKGVFAVSGIMSTLVIYGVLQEKIMRVPYGLNKEFFKYSLFLVFCNRLTTSAVSIFSLFLYWQALKYVSFPVQTLAKCAKMIPVMVWGTLIMQKKYKGFDYLVAFLVTLGCSVFILFPAGDDVSPYNKGRENTVWGVSLMAGYLGNLDTFVVTNHDCVFWSNSFTGETLTCHLLLAVDFVSRHRDCLVDIALLSTVATASQFFISYTIRTFGALTFAAIITTRQLGAMYRIGHLFSGLLYAKNLLNNNNKNSQKQPPPPPELPQYEKPEGS
ncbi:hypothetical protein Bca4012_025478 [Brassica carinata]